MTAEAEERSWQRDDATFKERALRVSRRAFDWAKRAPGWIGEHRPFRHGFSSLTRRIVAQPALQKYHPDEFKPGPEYQDDEGLARAAGDIGTTIFHPIGTCKMGDDPMAVVDDRLRLRGIGALRVVDASIMPTITSGNTCSPVIMIAEKAADMIREDARS